jgi:hypothetical protein
MLRIGHNRAQKASRNKAQGKNLGTVKPVRAHERKRRTSVWWIGIAVLVIALVWLWLEPPNSLKTCPGGETQLFVGITYGCERLERTIESGGLFHWTRIHLSAPPVLPSLSRLWMPPLWQRVGNIDSAGSEASLRGKVSQWP